MSNQYTPEFMRRYYAAHSFVFLDDDKNPVLSEVATAIWSKLDIARASFGFTKANRQGLYTIYLSPAHIDLLSMTKEQQVDFFHRVHPFLEIEDINRVNIFSLPDESPVPPYQIWVTVWINHESTKPLVFPIIYIENPSLYPDDRFLEELLHTLYVHTSVTDGLLSSAVGCSREEARALIIALSQGAPDCSVASYDDRKRPQKGLNPKHYTWSMRYKEYAFERVELRVSSRQPIVDR